MMKKILGMLSVSLLGLSLIACGGGETNSSDNNGGAAPPDRTPPVIHLLGDKTVYVKHGLAYADAGATANDTVDGDISANIVTHGQVNPQVDGEYTITYKVRDSLNNEAKAVYRKVVVATVPRQYGVGGPETVAAPWQEPAENKSVVYYPAGISTQHPTPVIFFAPGWGHTHDTPDAASGEAGYESMLRFIASHGYSVIFARDDHASTSANNFIEYFKTMAKHPDVAPYIDTSRIGLVGFSSGGGHAFRILKALKDDEGWGTEGRFLFTMEPWFAFDMNDTDMKNLPSNTNNVMVQFGVDGNNVDPKYGSQDPRILLTEYHLLDSIENAHKDYQVFENATHSYPEGSRPYAEMQGVLKPLDALMDYTFNKTPGAYFDALGVGSDQPLQDGIQTLKPSDQYQYRCYATNNDMQLALDRANINYCTIAP